MSCVAVLNVLASAMFVKGSPIERRLVQDRWERQTEADSEVANVRLCICAAMKIHRQEGTERKTIKFAAAESRTEVAKTKNEKGSKKSGRAEKIGMDSFLWGVQTAETGASSDVPEARAQVIPHPAGESGEKTDCIMTERVR